MNSDVDHRDGFYYVSVIDGSRRALASGPYETHQEALDAVDRVRAAGYKADPRSWFWAWGTARCAVDAGPGVLGKL